ncbi:MAG: biotin/lipoate A/B protein ligase family protein [Paludibacter sp.]|nr:biotin/lipoate A/B protein ligase family protein [Paludibacter sp.]
MKLIVSDRHDPAYHLALEEYLFYHEKDEFTLLYINSPSVIIGCNQVWENEVDADFCKLNNIPVLRRMSGGGAVYHDFGNLNYCFITNQSGERTSLSSEFLKPVVIALTGFGFQSVVGKRKDLWLPDGYKISGTASHIAAKREMHHGTLLYDTNLDHLANALNPVKKEQKTKGIASVPSPVKNILAYIKEYDLPEYSTTDFYKGIIREFKLILDLKESYLFDSQSEEQINLLADNKYRTDLWNKKK